MWRGEAKKTAIFTKKFSACAGIPFFVFSQYLQLKSVNDADMTVDGWKKHEMTNTITYKRTVCIAVKRGSFVVGGVHQPYHQTTKSNKKHEP